MRENQEIRVKGTVQGVGFRPTVYRLARECEVVGEVFNDAGGVVINLAGRADKIDSFLDQLRDNAPPLSKIDAIERQNVDADWQYEDFSISSSGEGRANTEVTADAATCRACLDEVTNPSEHRYLYPFTNCTHCGPRLSIIEDIPYDRASTTMRDFPMCKACKAEYEDPLDRRFHAQPVACHECGPRIFIPGELEGPKTLADSATMRVHTQAVLSRAVLALKHGDIVAIKGIGGYHLSCDAANFEAVAKLRQRKKRYAKPFALMSADREQIAGYCDVSKEEWETLESPASPIVLLNARANIGTLPPLSPEVAPGSTLLGFMMPYTPLHALLCQQFGGPLVMTSGNLSGEPQIIDNGEAIDKLADIADLIVCHNRDIANRIDDSVVRFMAGKPRLLRRARGYAPRSIQLPEGFQGAVPVQTYGAELKATFCLLRDGAALVSQHQGDLENLSTLEDYEKNLGLYHQLFEFEPELLAVDLHPEYLSTKRGRSDADHLSLSIDEIQHHHAHIAAAMADNGMPLDHPAVLGIALDGLGFGADNSLWGGEVLLSTYDGFKRVARLKPIAMPGGAQAAREPWRNALAQILAVMPYEEFKSRYSETALAKLLDALPNKTLRAMLMRQVNCPLASSTGRLFDAVAAATGLHPQSVKFEGQAAIELEMLSDAAAVVAGTVEGAYKFAVTPREGLLEIDPGPIWVPLLDDILAGQAKAAVATRFHAGFVAALMTTIQRLKAEYQFDDIVLSGGCFQNGILLEALDHQVTKRQIRCFSHVQVPANDGGIALGQAVIAASRAGRLDRDI